MEVCLLLLKRYHYLSAIVVKALTAVSFVALFVVAGCGNKKFEAIPDQELADSMHDCRMSQDQSPGMAIRCDNIERECQRRREDGRYVC